MTRRPVLAVVLAALVALGAGGCSSDDEPKASPLVQTLEDKGFSRATATCIEKAGKKADLTTKQIVTLATKSSAEITAEERQAYAEVFATCIGLDQSAPAETTP